MASLFTTPEPVQIVVPRLPDPPPPPPEPPPSPAKPAEPPKTEAKPEPKPSAKEIEEEKQPVAARLPSTVATSLRGLLTRAASGQMRRKVLLGE
ncbi:MAG: hypothetical protein FJX47_09015 [Alphaproteobacteria bacterium]|nr:hypothetical protein [Alphaproteobacteria bacterium]